MAGNAYTPREISKLYHVSINKVLAWIKRGELRGVNVATRHDGRLPRFIVHADDLAAFENRRSPMPKVERASRRRKAKQEAVTEYF